MFKKIKDKIKNVAKKIVNKVKEYIEMKKEVELQAAEFAAEKIKEVCHAIYDNHVVVLCLAVGLSVGCTVNKKLHDKAGA